MVKLCKVNSSLQTKKKKTLVHIQCFCKILTRVSIFKRVIIYASKFLTKSANRLYFSLLLFSFGFRVLKYSSCFFGIFPNFNYYLVHTFTPVLICNPKFMHHMKNQSIKYIQGCGTQKMGHFSYKHWIHQNPNP